MGQRRLDSEQCRADVDAKTLIDRRFELRWVDLGEGNGLVIDTNAGHQHVQCSEFVYHPPDELLVGRPC